MPPERPPIIGVTGPDKGGGAAWWFTRFAVWLAGGPPPGAGGQKLERAMRRMGGGGRGQSGFSPDVNGDAPAAIVDGWVARLIQRPLDAAKRQTLLDTLGQGPDDYSVRTMIQLIVSMPEYQLC